MRDILLLGFLYGGFAVGSLTAFVLLFPFARPYFGRRTLLVAAALPTLAFVGMRGISFFVPLSVATGASFFLVLPPLLKRPSNSLLKRPILPALAILAADAWNTYILVLASDPAFMGGSC